MKRLPAHDPRRPSTSTPLHHNNYNNWTASPANDFERFFRWQRGTTVFEQPGDPASFVSVSVHLVMAALHVRFAFRTARLCIHRGKRKCAYDSRQQTTCIMTTWQCHSAGFSAHSQKHQGWLGLPAGLNFFYPMRRRLPTTTASVSFCMGFADMLLHWIGNASHELLPTFWTWCLGTKNTTNDTIVLFFFLCSGHGLWVLRWR